MEVDDTADHTTDDSSSMIRDSNAWGVAAFVLGLVGTVLGLLVVTFAISFVLGVLAVVFGVIGLRKRTRRTMTAWGSGLGVASIAVSLVGGFLTLQLLRAIEDRVDTVDSELEAVLEDAIDDASRELETVLEDAVDDAAAELDAVLDEQFDRLVVEIRERDDLVDRLIADLDARVANLDAQGASG